MVTEGSCVLVLSSVEKVGIKSCELITTSVHLADNCGDIRLSSYLILAFSLEEGCSHMVAG